MDQIVHIAFVIVTVQVGAQMELMVLEIALVIQISLDSIVLNVFFLINLVILVVLFVIVSQTRIVMLEDMDPVIVTVIQDSLELTVLSVFPIITGQIAQIAIVITNFVSMV